MLTWIVEGYVLVMKHTSSNNGTKYSRVDKVTFFKGYLPQILLGPTLNTLSHISD